MSRSRDGSTLAHARLTSIDQCRCLSPFPFVTAASTTTATELGYPPTTFSLHGDLSKQPIVCRFTTTGDSSCAVQTRQKTILKVCPNGAKRFTWNERWQNREKR